MTDKTKRSFCNRHLPALVQTRSQDVYDREGLEKELDKVPPGDRQPIAHIWSVFSSAAAAQRLMILQGLLSTCCSSQLSFLSDALPPLLRIDFTVIFPPELCIQIFTYLDAQSLCAAAQVSHRWQRFADDDILWHRMCEQHIDRKCTKCGWGLPLLSRKRRIVRGDPDTAEQEQRKRIRPWKDVYSERLVIERNWRKNTGIRRVVLPRLRKDRRVIRCLQFCDIQNILIGGLADGTVLVSDLSGINERILRDGHQRSVDSLQFDETKLVTASADHSLRIWNYHTGECIRTLRGHTAAVTHLHFDSRILLSGSADRTVRVWNFEIAECYALHGHTDTVNHVRIVTSHARRDQVLSCSDDRSIRLWDLAQRACVRVFQGHTGPVQTAIPSMPGFLHRFGSTTVHITKPVFISGSLDNTLKVWALDDNEPKCLQTLFGHTHGITALDYDKLRLVSASQDGVLKVWDVERAASLHTIQAHTAPVTAVALSDTKIISASEDAEIVIWDYGVTDAL
ncbi:hypothetical protein DFQ30_002211 [Apophysomyces sp. BC1015]|nr:hypothetical protein DFQ30_002211 [Apophysomyces sp. BC1015]